MLKHFAQHVAEIPTNVKYEKSNSNRKKSPIPDLYPIKIKRNSKNQSDHPINDQEHDENVDSGFEDVNPIKFCQVTMEDKRNKAKQVLFDSGTTDKSILNDEKCKAKRFNCIYCSKSFGWSTDLKRHVLIHTGERPFKCDHCKLSFTRNFLLQKHKLKYHQSNDILFNMTKMKIPSLKPLQVSAKHKPRKQDKSNIKRKICSTKVVYQSNVKSLICSI